MKTTLNFERVVLIKELNEKFKKVGEVFEIANVFEDAFLLRNGQDRVAIGMVSLEDFENCFVHEGNFTGWTKWTPLTGFDGQTDAFYRTNRRKTQVRFLTSNVRGESCCHKLDDFNLFFGVQTAYLRALNKSLANKKSEYEKQINKIDSEIISNKNILKRMLNSLEV